MDFSLKISRLNKLQLFVRLIEIIKFISLRVAIHKRMAYIEKFKILQCTMKSYKLLKIL